MSIPTVVDNVTSVNATLLNAYKSEIEALQGRSVLAGTGLAGGGTLAADRTLSLDIAGLTALGVAVDQTADLLPIYDASGAVIRKVSAAALLPLTTKGDLLTHNGTAPERLAISTDGHVLTCQADGSANWEALPDSGAMQRIAVQSGAAASYSFTDIPGTYRDLRLVLNVRGDTAAATTTVQVKVNNDSTGIYSLVYHVQNGTNFSFSTASSNSTYIDCGAAAAASSPAGASLAAAVDFVDYRGAFFKSGMVVLTSIRTTTAGDNIRINGGWRWPSTDAITRIDITPAAGSWAAGSVATLYGIM